MFLPVVPPLNTETIPQFASHFNIKILSSHFKTTYWSNPHVRTLLYSRSCDGTTKAEGDSCQRGAVGIGQRGSHKLHCSNPSFGVSKSFPHPLHIDILGDTWSQGTRDVWFQGKAYGFSLQRQQHTWPLNHSSGLVNNLFTILPVGAQV